MNSIAKQKMSHPGIALDITNLKYHPPGIMISKSIWKNFKLKETRHSTATYEAPQIIV